MDRLKKARKPRIAITGLGPICALGIGVAQVTNALRKRSPPHMKRVVVDHALRRDGFMVFSPKDKHLTCSKAALNRLEGWFGPRPDPDIIYSTQAAELALRNAGLKYDVDDNNISLYLVHENPGLERLFQATLQYVYRTHSPKESFKAFSRRVYRAVEEDTYNAQSFMFLYGVTKALGLHGYSQYLNNACASGLYAIEGAARQIQIGSTEVAIVAGVDWPSRFIYKNLWFDWQELRSPRSRITPFQIEADGFVLGDAACGIVLEDMERAEKRRAYIYAEYLGGGFHLEGWKVTAPAGNSRSYVKALEQAICDANLSISDIDVISPHGVGTRVVDAYEMNGLVSFFGNSLQRKQVVHLKPLLGHTLGVCGLIETCVLLLQLTSQRKSNKNNVTALKISSGFAGFNGAAIFRVGANGR